MNRQADILAVFQKDYELILSKSEIIKKTGIQYYNNTSKWVGEILSRMVKNGSLTRVKKGLYRLGGTMPADPNQMDLFNGK